MSLTMCAKPHEHSESEELPLHEKMKVIAIISRYEALYKPLIRFLSQRLFGRLTRGSHPSNKRSNLTACMKKFPVFFILVDLGQRMAFIGLRPIITEYYKLYLVLIQYL